MNKSIPKIGLILIAVIVFPTLFFSAYEITNISSNERVVDSIYSSQLASIVFSLNQYSDDAVSRLADNIDVPAIKSADKREDVLHAFFKNNKAVKVVFFANDNALNTFYQNPFDSIITISKKQVETVILQEKEIINKLKGYIDGGYQRMTPVAKDFNKLRLVIFALREQNASQNLCGILIDPEVFISNKLGPKIQSMAQESFNISIFDKRDEQEVYTNEIFDAYDHNMRIKQDLWLFTNYEVGIQLVGDPIEHMVNERTRMSIIMIVLMDTVLLLGAWFVYRNVRQEIKLAQIKSEFVSNVSHEIKTPLALINMYSETLDMGRVKSEEKKSEYYKVINKEAKRLSRMVNKILNFSKIESGRREYNFIETDINELVEQVSTTYQHHFKNSGFTCNVNTGINLPLIQADEEALIDAVSNLIDNAIKYSGENKSLKINTGLLNDFVFVEIKDSGIGIKESEQKLIFDKFYRITQGNLANKAKGSGIGLNIVKHIVDAHNGKITLKSTLGEGSSFSLFFPIKNTLV